MQALFAAFWTAFFDALLTHLPQIYDAWKFLTTRTVTDADNPVALQEKLREQESNAIK